MADNTKTTIAILGLIGIGFVIGYDLAGLKKMFFGGDEPPPNWQAEQDSLRAELDREKIAHLNDLKLYTDSLRHYADSVQANRVHDTVYIPAVWRRVKLMDINAKMDSLKSL